MAPPPNPCFLFLLLLTFPLLALSSTSNQPKFTDPLPIPATWPLQFLPILLINNNGSLQKTDLWYDYPNGRNFNIIQKQLGELLYDLEWNNGTSFYYTLDAKKKCRVMSFSVGILRRIFLKMLSMLVSGIMIIFFVMFGRKLISLLIMKMMLPKDLLVGNFSMNGAAYCTSEVAVLKNDEIHAWDRCYDDNGNQVWGVKGGPYKFKPLASYKKMDGSFLLQK